VTAYEFRVNGRLSDADREALCDLEIEEELPVAVLHGDVTDESQLLGILAQFRALGLVVVSAQEVSRRTG
jgi:hypothetical protein